MSQVLIYLPLRSLSLILPISSGFEDFLCPISATKDELLAKIPDPAKAGLRSK
jgi:hypothetical protein